MKTPIETLLDELEWTPASPDRDRADWKDGDIPYATHEGVLDFGGISLRCVQLNTGERMFVADDVERLFGVKTIAIPGKQK